MAFLQIFCTIFMSNKQNCNLFKGEGPLILQNFKPSPFFYVPCIYIYIYIYTSNVYLLIFKIMVGRKHLTHLRSPDFEFGFSSSSSRILHHPRRRPPCCSPLWSMSPLSLLTEEDLVVSQLENYTPLTNHRSELEAPIILQEQLRIGLQG